MAEKRAQRARTDGFSLIELIVVITIIGILATAVVVNISGSDDQARWTTVQSDFRAIKSAANMFKLKYKRYPETLDELMTPPDGEEAYLDGSIRDPWTDELYIYELENNRPRLISYGSDQQEGQSGDEWTVDIDTSNTEY